MKANTVKAIRSALEALADEFMRRHPPLFHDLITRRQPSGDPVIIEPGNVTDSPMQEDLDVLEAFVEAQIGANINSNFWHRPQLQSRIFPGDINAAVTGLVPYRHEFCVWCGRFYGDIAGVNEFQRLATSFSEVLGQFGDPLLRLGGWTSTIFVLYQMAWQKPTPLLTAEECIFCETSNSGDDTYPVRRRPALIPSGSTSPKLPFDLQQWSLRNNLFVSASEVIRQLLDHHSVLVSNFSQTQSRPLFFHPLAVAPAQKILSVTTPSAANDSPSQTQPDTDTEKYVFRKRDNCWHLRFPPSENGIVMNFAGMERYAKLLAKPNTPLTATELMGLTTIEHAQKEAIVPRLTIEKWRRQAQEARAEADRRRDTIGSLEIVEALEEEAAKLEAQVESLNPYKAKIAQFVPSEKEKARKAVSKSLAEARKSISKSCPQLANHLNDYVKPNGNVNWMYAPPAPIDWSL